MNFLIIRNKKRHLSVTQNITEYLDLSRDHQDVFIITPLYQFVNTISIITWVIFDFYKLIRYFLSFTGFFQNPSTIPAIIEPIIVAKK